MNYEEFLRTHNLVAGDRVRIQMDGGVLEGIIMPHHEFSAPEIITIKLKNGYNVGCSVESIRSIELLERAGIEVQSAVEHRQKEGLPVVSIIGTGGTIASYVDYRTGAVHPAKSPDELIKTMPEIFNIANIKPRILLSILSEDMNADYWRTIAEQVAQELKESSGVVVAHGTDTMGYTAAALAFMFQELPGPVILVGSQRSSDRPSSDAYLNLLSAVRVASGTDLGEVCVLLHEGPSDTRCAIHRATKVRKMHTSRRDAFKSINAEPLGYVEGEKIEITGEHRKRGELVYDTKLEERVNLLYFYPNMNEELFHAHFDRARGVVIAGTGLGHVSTKFVPYIREYIASGGCVVMCSQCLYGTVNMHVYSTGRALLAAGIIDGRDMLPETAYVKLMWVLAHARDKDEVRRMMMQNIAGEISERREE